LCLPFLLLTASIGWAINSLWLYEYGFHKYDVAAVTGLNDTELTKAAVGLISYFNSSEQYIELSVIKDGNPFVLFNQREVLHLKDVKELIRLDYLVLLGTLLYALGYSISNLFGKKLRRLAWGVFGGSLLALVLVFTAGLNAIINEEAFERFFWQFHLISFANDFWLLDPTRDYLIMLFPEGFWYDATRVCVIAIAVSGVALGGISGWYLMHSRKGKSIKADVK
jgi:integral membrane protein (TIGR01906 family)